MSDFPADQLPLFVHPFGSYGVTNVWRMTANGAFTPASMTMVANQATYMPMIIPWEYPVNRVFVGTGTTITTSNFDFGIYSPSGAKIYSTGSTALSVTSGLQFVTPSVPFVLPAGMYYFAYVCSGTTNRGFGCVASTVPYGAMAGLLSQATALPLPTTATFATYVNPGIALCGVTRTQSGY